MVGTEDGDCFMPIAPDLPLNYPNLLNSSTTIQYYLPWQSMVLIDIYDILGRRIGTIAGGMKPAGEHGATCDANGQSSGIFFRIQAGDFAETRKMLTLK